MKPLNFTSLSRSTSFSERMRHPDAKLLIAPVIAIVLLFPLMLFGTIAAELLVVFVVSLLTIVGLAVYIARLYSKIGRKVNLPAFVQDNGMSFEPGPDTAPRASIFFDGSRSHVFTDMLRSDRHAFNEIGTFTFTSKLRSGQARLGYVHIKLPRKLPHIVLDGRKNNFLGASHLDDLNAQKITLEGNFNDMFTLYAPAEYATDALYIFTPDIMALFIDSVRDYDCEIIDDNFYIHSGKPFDLTSQSELEKIHTITSKLAEKLHRRTDYYADARIEGSRQSNVVAPQGARVQRKGVSVISAIIFLILCVAAILS